MAWNLRFVFTEGDVEARVGGPRKSRYCGIRCKGHAKVCRNIQKYAEIHINGIQKYAEVCRGIQKYAEVCRGIQKYAEIYQGMQKYTHIYTYGCQVRLTAYITIAFLFQAL